MRRKHLTGAMLSVVCVGALAPPAGAAPITYWWDHPCPCDGNRDETLTCSGSPPNQTCWCEGDWDDSANWSSINEDYPNHPNHRTRIYHSNTGCCNDNSQCSVSGDCTSGLCNDKEMYLKIDLITTTIGWLDLVTEQTNATADKLHVRFESKGTGGKTLTANIVKLDAVDGKVTVTVRDSATIQTDQTD